MIRSTSSVFKSLLLVQLLLLAAACDANDNKVDAEQNDVAMVATAAPAVEKEAVQWVLDGTDLIQWQDVKISQESKSLVGEFFSEQGGSELQLKVVEANGEFSIQRTYSEPGLAATSKSYTAKQAPVNGSVKAESFSLQSTSEGVLFLEINSGLESIPNTYWVHYLKKKFKKEQ